LPSEDAQNLLTPAPEAVAATRETEAFASRETVAFAALRHSDYRMYFITMLAMMADNIGTSSVTGCCLRFFTPRCWRGSR
jgi:hypothetical protein